MVISLTNLYFGFLSVNSVRKYLYYRPIFSLFSLILHYSYFLSILLSFFKQNIANICLFLLKRLSSPHFPDQIQQVVGETRKKQMNLVGHKPCIPGSCPLKMQRENPKYTLHPGSYTRKHPVPPLLSPRKRTPSTGFGQDATKLAPFTTLPPDGPAVIGLVRKDDLFVSLKKLIKDLGVMDIGRCTDKLRHKVAFGINGNVIFVAIDRLFALFGKGGIVVFSWASGSFDQAGVNDFSGFQFKALLSKLTFKLRETASVKVHGFEIRAEAGDSGIIGDWIYG